MDLTRPWTRALAGACALALLFSACGDDEDSSDTGDDTEQATEASEETGESTEPEEDATETTESDEESLDSTEPEEGPDGDPEAIATAEAVNLKLEDFAAGWTEEEPSDPADPDPIDECFTETDIESTRLGGAQSNSFEATAGDETSGQGQAVSMKTAVFDSPESATAVVEEVGGQAFADCVNEYLTTEVLEGVEAQLAPVVDDPPVGEQSAGLVGALSVEEADGSTTEGLIDMHVIRTGEIVSFTLTLDTLGDETFQQTLAELYTVIAERQAAEAG